VESKGLKVPENGARPLAVPKRLCWIVFILHSDAANAPGLDLIWNMGPTPGAIAGQLPLFSIALATRRGYYWICYVLMKLINQWLGSPANDCNKERLPARDGIQTRNA